jgi:radical SAM protein with 4Fe4S-binding SPASM domain
MPIRKILDELIEQTREEARLHQVVWEIIDYCNMRCRHCYVPPGTSKVSMEMAEMIVCVLKEREVLSVTLTGGEPFVHPDFLRIYSMLKQEGFLVSICTNGTLLDDEILKTFSELPPITIEISLYGSTPERYARTTGRDLFKVLDGNIQKMAEARLPISLKVPLMRHNRDDYEDLLSYSESHGVSFRIGTIMLPRLNRDQEPLKDQLDVEMVADLEIRDTKVTAKWESKIKYAERNQAEQWRCSSGRNSSVISADCNVYLCSVSRETPFSFNDEKTFQQALDAVNLYRTSIEKEYFEKSDCGKCVLSNVCPGCPARCYLVTGSRHKCVPFFREVTLAKMRKLFTAEEIDSYLSFHDWRQ